MRPLSRRTKLINSDTAPIVVRARRNGFIIPEFNVTIRPGSHVYVYYSDLGIEHNYSQPYVNAFLKGQEDEGQSIVVLTSVVRDNEVIVFGFDNGRVTVNPIEGKFLARFG